MPRWLWFRRPSGGSSLRETGRFYVVFLLLAGLIWGELQFASAAAPLPGVNIVTQTRPFRGSVRRDMAAAATRLAADLEVYEQAARLLTKEPDMHFIGGAEAHGAADAPGLRFLPEGVARMLFSTRLLTIGVEGFPPNLQAVVRLELLALDDLRQSLRAALQRPDLLELHAQLYGRQKLLLERYDALAALLLPLDPRQDGGREEAHRLHAVVNEMNALEIYRGLLPLQQEGWPQPEAARDDLLRAERLAPNSPLILIALAEVLLQLDRPVAALEHASRALEHNPGFARAHDVRGAVLLRQRLPVLAVEAFSKAIALAPRNGQYYMHRAAAYLVLEEEAGMCRDFRGACGLGICEGLQWATGAGRCTREAP